MWSSRAVWTWEEFPVVMSDARLLRWQPKNKKTCGLIRFFSRSLAVGIVGPLLFDKSFLKAYPLSLFKIYDILAPAASSSPKLRSPFCLSNFHSVFEGKKNNTQDQTIVSGCYRKILQMLTIEQLCQDHVRRVQGPLDHANQSLPPWPFSTPSTANPPSPSSSSSYF
jgi:hypothetical protein